VWLATWAVSLIARTTKRTPVQGSAIESGIPELTTGTCAEVGACIWGSREMATLPSGLALEEQAYLLHHRLQTARYGRARG
jgi:hypothetical protein